MQCERSSLTVFSMSFLLSRLTHINEAQNTYRLHHYEVQEEEEEGFHTLSLLFPSIMGDIWEITSVTYLSANWANKHVSHTMHLHHPNQASSEYLHHALCNALWEEGDCVMCFVSVFHLFTVCVHIVCAVPCRRMTNVCTCFHTVKLSCTVPVNWSRPQGVAGQ